MNKRYVIGTIVAVAILAVVILVFSGGKPKIILIDFETRSGDTHYGMATFQNVGSEGYVEIYAYGNEKLFEGNVYAGEVFKVQTGWWTLDGVEVVYSDGTSEYVD